MNFALSFLTQLSARNTSIFSFRNVNLNSIQRIFTRLGMHIDIVRILFWLLIGEFGHFLTELSAHDTSIFSFPDNNLSKCQWILTRHCVCIDNVKIWIGIGNGQISSIFDGYLPETRPYFHFLMVD